MLVNPEALRQYAEVVDATAAVIEASTIPADLLALAACMPGSDTAAGATYASGVAKQVQPQVAGYYSAMSSAVRTNAGLYEAEDAELAGKLSRIVPDHAP